MNVWRIYVDTGCLDPRGHVTDGHGHHNSSNVTYGQLRHRGVVAMGWPDLGNQSGLCGHSRGHMRGVLVAIGSGVFGPVPTSPSAPNIWWWGYWVNPAGHIVTVQRGHLDIIDLVFWYFLTEMQPGDIVLCFEDRQFMGITEICAYSKYSYNPIYHYAHCIGPVKWVDAQAFGFAVGTCGGHGFLGITKQHKFRGPIITHWQSYKTANGFDPCP